MTISVGITSGLSSSSLFVPGPDATVSTLYTNYPPANYPKQYKWVSDLFGGNGDYCISDGTYWKPVRPLAVLSIPSTSMTLGVLTNPPTILMTGTIGTGITQTIVFSTVNAFNGAKFRVQRTAGGGGVLVAGITNLTINSWADFEFDGTNWNQTASGGLL